MPRPSLPTPVSALRLHQIKNQFLNAFPLRDLTPCRPKGTPLYYSMMFVFGSRASNVFKKCLKLQHILRLTRKRAPKKTWFIWSNISKKFQKRLFWHVFQILTVSQKFRSRKFGHNKVFFLVFCESSEIQFDLRNNR